MYHIEVDKKQPHSIIFSTSSKLSWYNTERDRITDIAGVDGSLGYVNGLGNKARFHGIAVFTQLDAETIVVADSNNHCVRKIHRNTTEVTDHTGVCEISGFEDGFASSAKFNKPYAVYEDPQEETNLIIVDTDNRALRLLTSNTRNVSTLIQNLQCRPHTLAWQQSNNDTIYISCECVILTLYLQTFRHEESTSFCTANQQSWLGDIIWLFDQVLLLTDKANNQVIAHDLTSNNSYTICTGEKGISGGDASKCHLNWPTSLLRVNHQLFIGEDKSIRQIPGDKFYRQNVSCCKAILPKKLDQISNNCAIGPI